MSLLASIQAGAAAALSAHAFFSAEPAIPVLTEQLRDIESRIEAAVARMDPGICVIVVTATGDVASPNVPGPELSQIRVVCRVVENTKVNKTAQPAALVAEAVASILHQHRIPGTPTTLLCEGITLADGDRHLAYDITFSARGIIPAPARIA
jgi:hypothetical protein